METTITSLDHYGRGISRIDNKIIFIENALENEIVSFIITKTSKNFYEGQNTKIINKSKDRVTPVCPYYEICGGCNLMHMNYYSQLKFKQQKIYNIVNKYLNNKIKINNIIASDTDFNYRNKVTFQINGKLGFYKKKSNSINYIDNCMIANNKINSIVPYLNKLNLNSFSSVIVRTNNEHLMIILETISSINTKEIINTLKDKCNSIIIKKDNMFNCIYGKNYIINKIGNIKYYVTNDGFFQINDNVTFKLYSKIKEYCDLKGTEIVLDLYCGSGTIGLFISNKCKSVIGLEINKSSIDCANKNLELNSINNCKFIHDDAINFDKSIKADIIIVDPPRSGLNNKIIDKIISLRPKKIIYISCNPMTLVRDLKVFNNDYNIKEITPFDMFPHTYHVECVCVLKLR